MPKHFHPYLVLGLEIILSLLQVLGQNETTIHQNVEIQSQVMSSSSLSKLEGDHFWREPVGVKSVSIAKIIDMSMQEVEHDACTEKK